MKVIAKNKRAFYDYEVLKKYEAGLHLNGAEIKSIRAGNVNLKGSFISVRNGEAFWKGGFIKRWAFAADQDIEEICDRKLLLHKTEIGQLEKALNEQGNTIVPLTLGLVRGKAKLEIGLARGKKKYDKRAAIKKRDVERELQGKMKYQ